MSTHAGLSLPDVSEVRAALRARRERVLDAWQADGLGEGCVVVPAGLLLPVEGSDQHYGFRAHDDHYYLAGCRLPGQVLVCDPALGDGPGAWALFAYVASQEDRVWHGDSAPIESLGERLGIGDVRPISELGAWMGGVGERPLALLGNHDLLERPSGYEVHPQRIAALALDGPLTARCAARVVAGRRRKDAVELTLMRAAAEASRAGHLAGMRAASPGMSERALQVAIEHGFLDAGAERPAYGSIVVAGEHCAVLHATPGVRALADSDLVLVDAGAEVAGYDSDVTRTWPVSSRFSAEQRAVYEVVLAVQERAIAGVRTGAEYRAVHGEASLGIAQGLVDLGLLRGRPEDLVEQDAQALFFPHGIGHLIGLATHDVGGYAEGRERSDRPGLKFLRADVTLEDGFVVTIEPGIYFIEALLDDPELRRKHADHVVWERADAMKRFGGVRIEDDVVVAADDPEVITSGIPKSVEDIEALRS